MARILVVGAHPDDADLYAGGTAMLWRERGDEVRFVSMTNGDAGHHEMEREALARRRSEEAQKAASVAGVEYVILDHPDGELVPTLECRFEMIRLIRNYAPDLILTHRPNDYHPDHRYTSAIVLDSAYMVTVPKICPEVPHLSKNPVLGYLWDGFTKPCAFEAHVVIDIEGVMDRKWQMLDCHESQFYEWLAYNFGCSETVPSDPSSRIKWLEAQWGPHLRKMTEAGRVQLSASVSYAECFEIGEHGGSLHASEIQRLFPIPLD